MIELKRGDTWTQAFEWIQGTNNLPVNLTGCSAQMDLVSIRGNILGLSISSEDSPPGIIIEELDGLVNARMEDEETEVLTPGEYKTDLRLTFPDGTVKSTETFYFNIIENVTLPRRG